MIGIAGRGMWVAWLVSALVACDAGGRRFGGRGGTPPPPPEETAPGASVETKKDYLPFPADTFLTAADCEPMGTTVVAGAPAVKTEKFGSGYHIWVGKDYEIFLWNCASAAIAEKVFNEEVEEDKNKNGMVGQKGYLLEGSSVEPVSGLGDRASRRLCLRADNGRAVVGFLVKKGNVVFRVLRDGGITEKSKVEELCRQAADYVARKLK